MKTHIRQCLVRWFVVVVISVTAVSSVALAQDEYVRSIRAQLNRVRTLLEERDFDKTHEYKIDSVANRGTDSFTLTLKEDWKYVLVSVCDKDCSDIDVKVYDENGREVGHDTKNDDLPVVEVTPRWTGKFRIKIEMFRCSRSPCYYGIGVFGK